MDSRPLWKVLASEIKEASEGLQKKQAGYEERLATIERVKEVMQ
jgi:hypothetical protein